MGVSMTRPQQSKHHIITGLRKSQGSNIIETRRKQGTISKESALSQPNSQKLQSKITKITETQLVVLQQTSSQSNRVIASSEKLEQLSPENLQISISNNQIDDKSDYKHHRKQSIVRQQAEDKTKQQILRQTPHSSQQADNTQRKNQDYDPREDSQAQHRDDADVNKTIDLGDLSQKINQIDSSKVIKQERQILFDDTFQQQVVKFQL